MLFTFKTVALAVLAVVAVGNVVQGAPVLSSSSSSSSTLVVEGSAHVLVQRCVFLLSCFGVCADDIGQW